MRVRVERADCYDRCEAMEKEIGLKNRQGQCEGELRDKCRKQEIKIKHLEERAALAHTKAQEAEERAFVCHVSYAQWNHDKLLMQVQKERHEKEITQLKHCCQAEIVQIKHDCKAELTEVKQRCKEELVRLRKKSQKQLSAAVAAQPAACHPSAVNDSVRFEG